MDAVDRKILNHVKDHGRDSFRQIAKAVSVSPSTAMKRIREMEDSGVIRGYGTILDYDKLGYDIHVIVDVRVAKGKLHQIEKKIARHPAVLTVFDNTGSFDSTVIARFGSRANLDRFLKLLQTYDFVERTETKLILNTVKDGSLKL
ncbi:MAG: Lrp/AsnC family transcriptional regulator [Thermoplasmatota archaeon]